MQNSFFYWEGKVQSEEEVKEIHPDEVPCIISWEIDAGHEPFMKWIADETR